MRFVYQHLKNEILSGDLRNGVDISQVEVAGRLGVSRGPVREALRLLEREGFVASERNRRAKVAPFSWADMEEVFAARIVTETFAVGIGVAHFTAQDLAGLEEAVAEMDAVVFGGAVDVERWEAPHRRFHRILVRYGGSSIVRFSEQLTDHAERYSRVYLTEDRAAWTASGREHHAILDACKQRDGARARQLLGFHLAHTALTVIALHAPSREAELLREAVAGLGGRSIAEMDAVEESARRWSDREDAPNHATGA